MKFLIIMDSTSNRNWWGPVSYVGIPSRGRAATATAALLLGIGVLMPMAGVSCCILAARIRHSGNNE